MKLLGGSNQKIDKDKISKNVPRIELTTVRLVPCNVVNSVKECKRFIYYFCLDKAFGQLVSATPQRLIFLKTYN